MKNLIYFLCLGVFAAALFLGSCEQIVYPPIEVPDSLSYQTEIQPIWDAKCVSCHGSSLAPVLTADVSYDNLIDDGYIDTDNPEESELMKKLYSGSHDARANETEKQTILTWIRNGAKNN